MLSNSELISSEYSMHPQVSFPVFMPSFSGRNYELDAMQTFWASEILTPVTYSVLDTLDTDEGICHHPLPQFHRICR